MFHFTFVMKWFNEILIFGPKYWSGRRRDSNPRPQGYEPCELPNCSTPPPPLLVGEKKFMVWNSWKYWIFFFYSIRFYIMICLKCNPWDSKFHYLNKFSFFILYRIRIVQEFIVDAYIFIRKSPRYTYFPQKKEWDLMCWKMRSNVLK